MTRKGGGTCGNDAGKHPALPVLDGSFGVPVTLEDEHAALPFSGRFTASVIARPVSLEDAIVIGRIDLGSGNTGSFAISHSMRQRETAK